MMLSFFFFFYCDFLIGFLCEESITIFFVIPLQNEDCD